MKTYCEEEVKKGKGESIQCHIQLCAKHQKNVQMSKLRSQIKGSRTEP